MNVVEGDSIDDPTFFLRDDKWNIQLCTDTLEEKELWLTALFNAVQDYFKREGTLKKPDPTEANDGIGIERPTFENARNAISCSDEHCFETFGLMNRGKNCKACGKVFCSTCRNQKTYVPYMRDDGEVCKACFIILQKFNKENPPPEKEPKEKEKKPTVE